MFGYTTIPEDGRSCLIYDLCCWMWSLLTVDARYTYLYVHSNLYRFDGVHILSLTLVCISLAGDYLGSRPQHSPNRDWSDAVTEEEEQEQFRQRESSGYRGRRPRYRGGNRGSRREGFNTGSSYRPPQSREHELMFVFIKDVMYHSAVCHSF